MKVLLINIDSIKAPNIALKKVEMYHHNKGDEIFWDFPLAAPVVDKIYVSCIFSWNKKQAEEWEHYKHAVIGGSGYNVKIKLPHEIEKMNPHLNYGFTSRGCTKKCKYCIVPIKEGKIRATGDIYDLWDRKSKKITLLDNNIMALPGHFQKICKQLLNENLKVDFQQGLDMDYLNSYHISLLQKLRHNEYKFAWDNNDFSTKRIRKISNIFYWFGKCQFYVLVGNLPFNVILKKLNILKNIGHNGYIMRLERVMRDKLFIALSRWVNQKWTFHKYTFEEFCKIEYGDKLSNVIQKYSKKIKK